MELTAFEKWMIKSNIQSINSGMFTAKDIIDGLRFRGYIRIANAVESEWTEAQSGCLGSNDSTPYVL